MGIRKETHTHTQMGNQKTCTKVFYLPGVDVDITQWPDKLTKSSTKSRYMRLYTIQIHVC